MNPIRTRTVRRVAAAAALTLAAAAQAQTIIAQTAPNNQIFGPGPALVGGMTTPLFFNALNQRFIVHFASECSVNAPAGNNTAWTDVDIQVLNAAGAVVRTLPPTIGNMDAFCGSDGVAGFSSWASNAVIGVSGPGLPAGGYRVRVIARLNGGATQGWFGERTLLVTR